jgi:hypothetical protein
MGARTEPAVSVVIAVEMERMRRSIRNPVSAPIVEPFE